tara:strand:- start:3238 stop:3771 length:534 start_codon:yes stop_codon:yes gene_type:complete
MSATWARAGMLVAGHFKFGNVSTVKSSLISLALIVLAMIIGTCLVSMMVLFMGGGQQAPDLHGLLLLQVAAIPLALLAFMVSSFSFVAGAGWRSGMADLWRAAPQWVLFAFVFLNSLFIIGELSFYLVARGTGEVAVWQEHIPILCMLICSLAFCGLLAQLRVMDGHTGAVSGRWSS